MTSTSSAPAPAEIARTIGPQGVLRAAINLANPILTQQPAPGELQGASLLIAAAVARELGLRLHPVPFTSAGEVTKAAAGDAWDLGFLAIDPGRAELIRFSRPYLYIESTYLVRHDGPDTVAAVDAPGIRIALAKGAAYDLFLARELRHASLIHTATPTDAFRLFADGGADAVAGVRQALRGFAQQGPYRVLDGQFQQVQHAVALPARAAAALPWLDAFLTELKRTGYLKKALSETGQADATLAP
jgi:polar amino acid transport system substrate-binding protein